MLSENFYNYKISIKNNMVVHEFITNNNEMTELRIIDFLEKTKQMIETFYEPKIKKICLIYNIENINFLPSNTQFIKKFSELFNNTRDVIKEKVEFTIIQSNSNIFNIFFNLFTKYYEPAKPLYLCKNNDETEKCLFNKDNIRQTLSKK